jgi:hypothetical protein
MIDTKAPDQGLKLAKDGQMHTPECVDMGWWLLDWDVDCVHVGVPEGGQRAALAERALFTTALVLLPVATAVTNTVEAVRRGR